MGKILINLLPPELALVEKKRVKKIWIVRVTSFFMVVVIVIASAILGFGVVKSGEEHQKQQELQDIRNQVSSLNNQEGYLTLLKQKLAKITNFQGNDFKRITSLNFISSTTPAGISLLTLSVDKNGQIKLGAKSTDSDSLNNFLTSLSDDKTAVKVSKITVNSLSLGANNEYRFDLDVAVK